MVSRIVRVWLWRSATWAATALALLAAGWWCSRPEPQRPPDHPRGFHRHTNGRWYLDCDHELTEDEAAMPWMPQSQR